MCQPIRVVLMIADVEAPNIGTRATKSTIVAGSYIGRDEITWVVLGTDNNGLKFVKFYKHTTLDL